jgi:hypothetical protein
MGREGTEDRAFGEVHETTVLGHVREIVRGSRQPTNHPVTAKRRLKFKPFAGNIHSKSHKAVAVAGRAV